ncbi:MAG: hypothetical protein HYY77_00440 [Betaproteobacteria bacterium]|nr:hypothetical protein [Betaproteobacteria bacterium]
MQAKSGQFADGDRLHRRTDAVITNFRYWHVIDSATCLKLIARIGVGVDRIDLQAATEHGVFVTNTPYTLEIDVPFRNPAEKFCGRTPARR